MQHKSQYLALLKENDAHNNLLVLQLLISQQKWSTEKALQWILEHFVSSLEQISTISFYFGNVGLALVSSQSRLMDEKQLILGHTYRIIIRYYLILDKKKTLLYKTDYLEQESKLLAAYHHHLLENIKQIIPVLIQNFN
ncbi:hypothetical protein [Aureispira anguillae]|uniref:Uncharacterized protein n=1 Tax=Aureispira anguillae TaxID=2864201 RepID=A0A916DR26_9BACT|nr:hypothetical protein [Aureispira anguillae]BDS09971.1 hypothetical protein AsAng_0006760 [Aureispira anguillae]